MEVKTLVFWTRVVVFGFVGVVVTACLSTLAYAQDSVSVQPGQVFQVADQIEHEVKALQEHLGVVSLAPEPLEVFYVSPREAYYQALLLQNKVEFLRLEKTGAKGVLRTRVPSETITSSDVLSILEEAQDGLATVSRAMKVDAPEYTGELDLKLSSSRALKRILVASAQLDSLLGEHPIVPSDVYQVVSRTIQRLHFLRQRFGDQPTPPRPKPIESMSSGAVFNGLRRSYVFVRQTLFLAGVPVMALGDIPRGDANTTSAESLVMAQFLYSHVDTLYRQLSKRELPPGSYFPGPTTSADVYTLVHQLELMAWELSESVKGTPNWLNDKPLVDADSGTEEPSTGTTP